MKMMLVFLCVFVVTVVAGEIDNDDVAWLNELGTDIQHDDVASTLHQINKDLKTIQDTINDYKSAEAVRPPAISGDVQDVKKKRKLRTTIRPTGPPPSEADDLLAAPEDVQVKVGKPVFRVEYERDAKKRRKLRTTMRPTGPPPSEAKKRKPKTTKPPTGPPQAGDQERQKNGLKLDDLPIHLWNDELKKIVSDVMKLHKNLNSFKDNKPIKKRNDQKIRQDELENFEDDVWKGF